MRTRRDQIKRNLFLNLVPNRSLYQGIQVTTKRKLYLILLRNIRLKMLHIFHYYYTQTMCGGKINAR